VQPDWARHQVCELQAFRIRLLVANYDVEIVFRVRPIISVANTPERQFQIGILFCSPRFAYDVRQPVMVTIQSQEMPDALQSGDGPTH
jgi:hypothetical protein